MELDPKALKEINAVVDGFVKKNKDAVQNSKLIMKLQKRVAELEKDIADIRQIQKSDLKWLEDKIHHNDKALLKRIQEIEKSAK